MGEFNSRAVRSLVELHECELQSFIETFRRFESSGLPMPPAYGDPDYETREDICAHVLRAARIYLTWIGDCLKRPVTDVDKESDVRKIAANAEAFAAALLITWHRHLVVVKDDELGPAVYKSPWGDMCTIETMLEHAVVHPMRHRIQLERILEA